MPVAKLGDAINKRRQVMGIKSTIRFQPKEGDLPGWQLYTELFEPEDAVYLELEVVQSDLAMIGSPLGQSAGTLLIRLPALTAAATGPRGAGVNKRLVARDAIARTLAVRVTGPVQTAA
ncbi:hypothetical protein AB4Y36_34820 [Paraburkholderia sp. BR10936]|uniref:hypothetical protein n=1 Tax=Paraburkholderia sp. BR10936 TaxID=3236993 RepID=UPI0034D18754